MGRGTSIARGRYSGEVWVAVWSRWRWRWRRVRSSSKAERDDAACNRQLRASYLPSRCCSSSGPQRLVIAYRVMPGLGRSVARLKRRAAGKLTWAAAPAVTRGKQLLRHHSRTPRTASFPISTTTTSTTTQAPAATRYRHHLEPHIFPTSFPQPARLTTTPQPPGLGSAPKPSCDTDLSSQHRRSRCPPPA